MALLKEKQIGINRLCFFFIAVLGWGLWIHPVYGADDSVIAVLTSNTGAYKEALQGFQEVYGHPIPTYALSEGELHIPAGTRVILAIGGKAALTPYPEKVALVYTMAPGLLVKRTAGRCVQVHPLPPPSVVLDKFEELQPHLKRLAIIWNSESTAIYLQELQKVAAERHIELISMNLLSVENLPDQLRALGDRADAFWLTPDPLVVNRKSFSILKEYAQSKRVPFYAPTSVLVGLGATASIGSSFYEMGRAAASAVKEVLSDNATVDVVYPQKIEVVVNQTALARIGQEIPAQALEKVDKIIP